ncbi:dnajc16 family protein [Megaselia abdita]
MLGGKFFLFIVSYLVLVVVCVNCDNLNINPYTVLGLKKDATAEIIRQQYKKLVKEWHPDKSKHPQAEAKFIEITKAYELLSDPDRRSIYDNYGILNEDSVLLRKGDNRHSFHQEFMNPFEEDLSLFHEISISQKYFDQYVISKSKNNPYLIIIYSNFCFKCSTLVSVIKKLQGILDPLGIRFASINAAHEPQLMRKIGVNSVPSLILVIDQNYYIYREPSFKGQHVIDFVRRKLPYKVVTAVDDSNIEKFLQGWIDNRVRVLIFQPKGQIRLRYLLAAFKFRHRAAFGFTMLNTKESQNTQKQFNVHPNADTMLIFHENVEQPVASISMNGIQMDTLNDMIFSNQYLTLPRLSSQEILENLCPAEWNRPKKRLCVVLVIQNSIDHNIALQSLRKIASRSSYSIDRVRYTYIFEEKQPEFLKSLDAGFEKKNFLNIVIIWRRDNSHIKYEWVNDFKEGNKSEKTEEILKLKLDSTIQRLLQSTESLDYEAFVSNLLDEHAQGLFGMFMNKMLFLTEYLYDNVQHEHLLAFASVVGTIAFILIVGYIMANLVRIEEENLKKNGKIDSKSSCKTLSSNHSPELKLHELRVEKYNGLVRLLKPGCRTIILITDLNSRKKLIPDFHKAVWPYRKNKTLMFGHMLIEKGLCWYSELLRLSLSEPRSLQINPKNCVGTVIALNGHRKYFCVYHAKHPDSKLDNKRIFKMAKYLVNDVEEGLPQFLAPNGLNTKLTEENLLMGLSNWLDRLFEGMTDRYYVNYWPDFSTK